MLIKDAKQITESLTKTSKMPGKSYSLPAWECKTGWKLAQIPGTPCFSCYAKKGNYTRYPKIKEVQYKRLKAIDNPLWVEAMAVQIKDKYFRWHDAGDIQSIDHLRKIFEVCRLTPNTLHWLPTQERQFILGVDKNEIPDNLIIRLSGSKVDGSIPNAWEYTSTVVTKDANCPSSKQNGQCLDCRQCWDKSVKNVSYGKH